MSHVNVSTRDMSVARLVVFMIGCAAVSTSVLAQPTGDSAPRTAWGVPDVQGFWHLDTLTPLERPSGFESTPRVTGEEAAAFLQQRRDAFNRQYDAILSADFFAGRAGQPTTSVLIPFWMGVRRLSSTHRAVGSHGQT